MLLHSEHITIHRCTRGVRWSCSNSSYLITFGKHSFRLYGDPYGPVSHNSKSETGVALAQHQNCWHSLAARGWPILAILLVSRLHCAYADYSCSIENEPLQQLHVDSTILAWQLCRICTKLTKRRIQNPALQFLPANKAHATAFDWQHLLVPASSFHWRSIAVNITNRMGAGRLGLGALAAVGGANAGKKAWDTLRQVGNGHGAREVSRSPCSATSALNESLVTALASSTAGLTVGSSTASLDRRTC